MKKVNQTYTMTMMLQKTKETSPWDKHLDIVWTNQDLHIMFSYVLCSFKEKFILPKVLRTKLDSVFNF